MKFCKIIILIHLTDRHGAVTLHQLQNHVVFLFSLWWFLRSAGFLPVASDVMSRSRFVAEASSAEAGLWRRGVPSENQREPR